jgi:arylsulfatase
MRGKKTTLWEGGHRVPCFISWPRGDLRQPCDIGGLTQVQDLLPTLIDLCDIPISSTTRFDGISLSSTLKGKSAQPPEERMLVINYSRMPYKGSPAEHSTAPTKQGAAVLWKRWRLLEDRQLYNLDADPLQENDVAAQFPEVVQKMRGHLDAWWSQVADLSGEFLTSRIGAQQQNPVTLTACEWADVFLDQQLQIRRGDRKNGLWHIQVVNSGKYSFTLRRFPAESDLTLRASVPETAVSAGVLIAGPGFPIATARIQVGSQSQSMEVNADDRAVTFEIPLEAGSTTLQTWFDDASGKSIAGANFVTIERTGN